MACQLRFSSLWSWFTGPQTFKVVMIGLDNAGKTTLLYKLLGQPKEVGQSYPTTGFNLETLAYRNVSLIFWDLGCQGNLKLIYHHYFVDTHAVIFVVDSSDAARMDQARDLLHTVLKDEQLKDAKLLIFNNKIELPISESSAFVAEELGIKELLNREWTMQSCSMSTGEGIEEGMGKLYLSITEKKRLDGAIN